MIKKFLFVVFLLASVHNLAAQTQLEMNQTADAKYKKADAELNKIYKKLVGKLDANAKQLLIASEKNWIKYRDSQSKFNASQFEGGSMQPLVYLTCLEDLTRKRIAELKACIKDWDL